MVALDLLLKVLMAHPTIEDALVTTFPMWSLKVRSLFILDMFIQVFMFFF